MRADSIARTDVPAPALEARCASCGALAPTAFCAECGAEQGRPPDLSLRSFVRAAVRSLTELDSRLLATLHALLLRPGLLTREYVRGRGGRFLGPIRTFFLANATFFIAHSLFLRIDTFTTHLETQLWNWPAARLKATLVARKLIAEHSTLPALAARWNAAAVEHGKTLVVLLVPIYAAILMLVLAYRRRPLVEHVVFATHIVAFVIFEIMLLHLCMMPAVDVARRAGIGLGPLTTDAGSSSILGAAFLVYLVPALRRAYDTRWPVALLLAPVLVFGFLVALQIYRFALFFSVYLAV